MVWGMPSGGLSGRFPRGQVACHAIKPNPHESHDPPTREVELAGVPMEQGHMSSWAVVAGLGFLVVAFSAVTKVYE